MKRLTLSPAADGTLRVLALGAHSDDVEIGCAGTLLRLADEVGCLAVEWVVFSADDEREAEARASAGALLNGSTNTHLTVHHFRDGYLPARAAAVKDAFEELKSAAPPPDVVFTHFRGDAHQDHRLVGELTWQTFRDALILEYEVPKYDGDLGAPNLFVPLPDATSRRKVDHLLGHFPSQHGNHWYSAETFRGLMRLRGIESNATDGWAEAFYCRKVVI